MWEVWEVFAPNVYLGVKNMCKKFQKVVTLGCDLLRVTVLTTPPNRAMDSPMGQKFQNVENEKKIK